MIFSDYVFMELRIDTVDFLRAVNELTMKVRDEIT